MPVTTNMGTTHDDHRTMLQHLITIGRAVQTSPFEWGNFDNLEAIVGVGESFAARLRDLGVMTAPDLVKLDEGTKQELVATTGISEGMVEDWRAQAGREAGFLNTRANGYLHKVSESARYNVPIERIGFTNVKARRDGGEAKVETYDLFAAPDGHRASARLGAALRAYVGQSDGRPRVPNLNSDQVEVLARLNSELSSAIDDTTMANLNGYLDTAGVVLRRAGDPPQNKPDYQQTDSAYGVLPDFSREARQYVTADDALGNRSVGDVYDSTDSPFDASAETSLRNGIAVVRDDGTGLHPPLLHEETQGSGEDGEGAPTEEGAPGGEAGAEEGSGEAEAEVGGEAEEEL